MPVALLGDFHSSDRASARSKPFARVLALLVALAALSRASSAQAPNDVSQLNWLSGCWQRRTATTVIEEQWMVPRGGTMMGMSRTSASGVTREFEFLRIAQVNGVVTYLAQPGGGAVTPFPAIALSDSMVTFSNPAHDFPQRIIYRRGARGDLLLARIEGTRGTQVRGIDFPMQRVACPAGREGPAGASGAAAPADAARPAGAAATAHPS
jgi:hypothetical protein